MWRQRATNCRHTLRIAEPLSRRKSAIVLKSGFNILERREVKRHHYALYRGLQTVRPSARRSMVTSTL